MGNGQYLGSMRIVFFVLCLFNCFTTWAQTTDTIYLDGRGERCNVASADYYRVILKFSDNYYSITDYTLKGDKLRMTGSQNKYLSTDPANNIGKFVYYDSNGRKEREGHFINGWMEGTWIFYSGDGSVMTRVNLVKGDKNGEAEMFDFGNGKTIAKGRFYLNNKVGEWLYYDNYTGALRRLEKYDSYGFRCDGTDYDDDSGKVVATYHLKYGLPDSTYMQYYPGTTKLEYKMEYRKGYLEGNYYHFDSATQLIKEQGTFKHNNRIGIWKKFYTDTSKVMAIENYAFGDLDGDMSTYDEFGRLTEMTKYKFGKKEGNSKIYHPTLKQVWIDCNYKNDSLHGNLTAYYEDGKVKRAEVYNMGKLLKGTCYAHSSAQVPCKPLFTEPRFARDVAAYVSDSLVYPLNAKINKTEGKVIVRFVVSEYGKVIDAEVMQGLDKDCNEEAIRLVSLMPAWVPGQLDGKPHKMYQTIAVVFKIN